MRGAPLIQTIFIVIAFFVAGVPVYRLTRPAEAAVVVTAPATPAADHGPAKSAPLNVGAIFAPAPADFQIANLGQTVLAGRGPQARFTGQWEVAVPPEGVDLVVHARWPVDGNANAEPRAMKVTVLLPGGGVRFEKTLWAAASGELDEALTVPGEATTAD